jgi:hypothetical protein
MARITLRRMGTLRNLIAGLTAGCVLAACGVSIGLGLGPDDDPPNISLAAAPQSAAPGERIGLVAAANDDFSVVEVQFYRIDVGGDTLLGRDTSAPYALETVLPAGATGAVRYFARAIDDAGQRGESQVVAVTVR